MSNFETRVTAITKNHAALAHGLRGFRVTIKGANNVGH
jgi:hypothetical protein